ncbi:Nbl1 / Borealin N terminal [Teratosphaeria destructans]|uniref:Nbl1 / Borealin N terminal n=1 Tax=Teratosphaeria destructans TaxID=418781 RepID=A0A9W7VYN8_9PEZI|nr:Nbl1 / Borealin N terminal [Teratosphaeria destructans]
MPPKKQQAPLASPFAEQRIPSMRSRTTVPTQIDDDAHTSEPRSPAKRPAGITQAQKQALIDNLQLEVTERARKLRAQYALQAQGLRARLEMRVNRIPSALRKRNIQELHDEHMQKSRPAPAPPVPKKDVAPAIPPRSPLHNGLKRHSDAMETQEDKENAPAEDLTNPKKRAKTVTVANTKAARTASKKLAPPAAAPPKVLSPKSHNSRTYPQSPFKNTSSTKLSMGHPTSPVKPPSLAPPKQTTRPASRQTKRGAAASEKQGRSSEASDTSNGTTIVHKIAGKKAPAAAKKVAMSKTTAAGRKAATTKKENAPPPAAATGGRTLRKRG